MPWNSLYLHNVSTYHTWMSSRGIIRLCTPYKLSSSHLPHWKPHTLDSVMFADSRHYKNRSNIYLQLFQLKYALFSVSMQQAQNSSFYWRFGTTYPSHLQGSSSRLGLLEPWRWNLIGCPKTSVTNSHPTLCKIPDKRRSHLYCGGSLKSRTVPLVLRYRELYLSSVCKVRVYKVNVLSSFLQSY
jgi:hypothetical protein